MALSKIVRRLLSIVLFWVIFSFLFAYAQDVIIPKDNAWDNSNLFNHLYGKYTNAQRSRAFEKIPKNSVDVAFIGSSIVFCGINPIEMYEQRGIASHDFAVGALSGVLTNYMTSIIYETQRPKLIVLDATLLFEDSLNMSGEYLFPYTKLTPGKIQFALQSDHLTTALECLVPMLMCHQNWPNVNADDFLYTFAPQQDDLLGMVGVIRPAMDQQALFQSYSYPGMVYADNNLGDHYQLTDLAKQQLLDFRDACLSEGAQPLLIVCPSVFGNENTSFLLQVEDYASTLGIDMINFNLHREGLNLTSEDFADMKHLTLTGMSKFSTFLADYLKAHYDLPDRRGQEGYERYDHSVVRFHETMQKLNEQEDAP